jgi:hypothetical protein
MKGAGKIGARKAQAEGCHEKTHAHCRISEMFVSAYKISEARRLQSDIRCLLQRPKF